jgi:hypothetical protein
MDNVNSNIWVVLTVVVIWIVVIITSLNGPDLMFGEDPPVVVPITAVANWLWGLLGTVFVLRATVFRRPNEIGWGHTKAWPWVFVSVSFIWFVALLVTSRIGDVVINETIIIPVAAIAAPIVAAVLTLYTAEFLVAGFASRDGL